VALLRVVDLDPGEVVRAVLRIARLRQTIHTTLLDGLGSVHDREAILHVLAVREHGILDGRVGLTRRHEDVDLVDLFERLQAGAGARTIVLPDVQRSTAGDLLTVRVDRLLGIPLADIDDETTTTAV